MTVLCAFLVVIFSIIAFFGFLKKSDQWTVYKPSPDWRAAANYFDSEIKNPTKRLFLFAKTPADVLSYYFERGKTLPAQIEIHYESNIHDILSAKEIRTFYLIKNKY